jgi:molybdopterin molybdotransferase
VTSFDDLIVVDWSASSIPTKGTDSCWVAVGRFEPRARVTTTNYSTRVETAAAIEARLRRNLGEGRRTLVALDVSFGFAAGATRILGIPGRPPWRALWRTLEERIEDDERNANNRFDVADELNASCGTRVFWGRPVASNFDRLTHLPIKDVGVPGLAQSPLPRLRACEELVGPGVISNWMLIGKGAVGGQVLTCLPYLERMRRTFGEQLKVWPFDGLDAEGDVVLAETWFGLYDWKGTRGSCRDESQVRGTHRALTSMEPRAFGQLFAPASLAGLSTARQRQILNEEGWSLGVR